MSEQYHKAKKQYALFSGIVLVWMLVGIRVDTEKPIDSIRISLLTPEAIPVILVVILIYFGYRTTIEWFQCEPKQRGAVAARVDCLISHLIGLLALSIYVGQHLVQFPIGEKAPIILFSFAGAMFSIMFGIWSGVYGRTLFQIFRSTRNEGQANSTSVVNIGLLCIASMLVVAMLGLGHWALAAVGFFTMAIVCVLPLNRFAGFQKVVFEMLTK